MKKYLVFVNGLTYFILADSIQMADTGVISMVKGEDIIATLPHGASVIQEDAIIKPEASTIVKPMHVN